MATLYAWAGDKMSVEVDPASFRTAVAHSPKAAPRTASPGCGPDKPAARVAEAPREEPNNEMAAPRQQEVRVIAGGVIQIATTN